MPKSAFFDDLLPLFEAMIGGPVNREVSDAPPLCDEDIERCICDALANVAGVRVVCDHGWVTVVGDVEPWDEVERVTLRAPGVHGLTRHATHSASANPIPHPLQAPRGAVRSTAGAVHSAPSIPSSPLRTVVGKTSRPRR